MQLNSNWSQSESQIELHLFWVVCFIKKGVWKWCNLIQISLIKLVSAILEEKVKLSCTFFGFEIFLKKWNWKWCNLIQSGLSLIKCVLLQFWKKEPNWVAPFLGWSFLKEMKFKMMQLNSKSSQSKNLPTNSWRTQELSSGKDFHFKTVVRNLFLFLKIHGALRNWDFGQDFLSKPQIRNFFG